MAIRLSGILCFQLSIISLRAGVGDGYRSNHSSGRLLRHTFVVSGPQSVMKMAAHDILRSERRH